MLSVCAHNISVAKVQFLLLLWVQPAWVSRRYAADLTGSEIDREMKAFTLCDTTVFFFVYTSRSILCPARRWMTE